MPFHAKHAKLQTHALTVSIKPCMVLCLPIYRLKEMMVDIPYQQCDETTVQIIRDGREAE